MIALLLFRIALFCAVILSLFVALTLVPGCTQTAGPPPTPDQVYARWRPVVQAATIVAVHTVLVRYPDLAPLVAQIARAAGQAMSGPLDVTQLLPLLQVAIAHVPMSAEQRWLVQGLAGTVITAVQATLAAAGVEVRIQSRLAADVVGFIEAAAVGPLALRRAGG